MQTYVKDSQNPYRTGVLVGNHTEDRFGQELSAIQVLMLLNWMKGSRSYQTPASEQQRNFHLGNSMKAFEF